MSNVRVRGALVLSQRALMERLAGADTVAGALDTLPPAWREAYASATVLSWVPQPAVREVTRGVANAMSTSPVELAEQVVAESVRAACEGPWNILLRMTSNAALLSRAATLFGRAFDVGDFEARAVSTQHGVSSFELTLRGWPEAHDMDLASVAAGVRATLRAARRDATVEYARTSDGASFFVTTAER